MGFFAEVKFLSKLFKTKIAVVELVDELEKETELLKERVAGTRANIFSLENELKKLKNEEESFKEKIQKLEQSISENEEKFYTLHRLESTYFLKTLIHESGYVIYKLNLNDQKINTTYNSLLSGWCYKKETILKAVNFKIQEFTAQEGISYEKLKKALCEINGAWFEAYDSLGNEIREEDYITKLLLTSFMILGKKEDINKKVCGENDLESN